MFTSDRARILMKMDSEYLESVKRISEDNSLSSNDVITLYSECEKLTNDLKQIKNKNKLRFLLYPHININNIIERVSRKELLEIFSFLSLNDQRSVQLASKYLLITIQPNHRLNDVNIDEYKQICLLSDNFDPSALASALSIIINCFKMFKRLYTFNDKESDYHKLWFDLIKQIIKLQCSVGMNQNIQQLASIGNSAKYDAELFEILFYYQEPYTFPMMIGYHKHREYGGTYTLKRKYINLRSQCVPSFKLCRLALLNCSRITCSMQKVMEEKQIKPFIFALWTLSKQLKEELTNYLNKVGKDVCGVGIVWNVISEYIIDHSTMYYFKINNDCSEKFIIDAFNEFILYSTESLIDIDNNINDAVFVMNEFLKNDVVIKYLEKQTSSILLGWLVWITRKYDADNVAILFLQFVKFENINPKKIDKIIKILLKYCMNIDQFELIYKLLNIYTDIDGNYLSNIILSNKYNILTYAITRYPFSNHKSSFHWFLKAIIMKKGFDCNQCDGYNEYPLLKACKNDHDEIIDIIKLLVLDGNANINIIIIGESEKKQFIDAIKKGNINAIRCLSN